MADLAAHPVNDEVTVIIGVGGMGQAIARRIGSGVHLLLADYNAAALETTAESLRGVGYRVTTAQVDVAEPESVRALARRADELGPVLRVVHTAGLSPTQAPVEKILAVDLLGVALVIDAFGEVVRPGGAGVIVASMAGHGYASRLTAEQDTQLATAPADELLNLPVCAEVSHHGPGACYAFSKRANQLRVQAASTTWGAKGARINSVSPGIIATPMSVVELDDGPSGDYMRSAVAGSNARRMGTTEDIAHAVEFLLTPAAGFISGTDLLIDGGVTAAGRGGPLSAG